MQPGQSPGGTASPGARAAGPGAGSTEGGGEAGRSFYKRISEQERNEIVAAIERAQGNIAHAARSLGINRSTLYYRMRKHDLEHLLPTRDEHPAERCRVAAARPRRKPGARQGARPRSVDEGSGKIAS